MKIRIKGDSIRYRLTKTDVADLKDKGEVHETTQVHSDTVFNYRLRRTAEEKNVRVVYDLSGFTILLPEEQASTLTDTAEIGIYATIDNDKSGLKIVIEKDLKCLDETEEDQSDMYENPKSNC